MHPVVNQARYNRVTEAVLSRLQAIVGEENVSCDPLDLEKYGQDETEDLLFLPEVVVKPQSTEEVATIMKLATEERIPVTPRGGGTGLSGGALPLFGGIILSVERMNRILEIDRENLFAVVEPGVVTEVFQDEVEKMGLYYPPDPASRGSCLLGGNIAECAGGPRAVKYGVTKDFVYGLEAVLPSGAVIRPGGKLLKNVTGYNLTQLLVGSEGTLAIVTRITLKLVPLPLFRRVLLIPFDSLEAACRLVGTIFQHRIVPSACEFMERDAVRAGEEHLNKTFPFNQAAAQLLVEIDGNDEAQVTEECEKIGQIALEEGALDVLVADTRARQQEIWAIRRSLGVAVKGISIYKEEDTVVPRARLPALVQGLKAISAEYGLRTICYGHAGDGNIHANIVKEDMPLEKWEQVLPEAIRRMFELTVSLGGSISGEHGIGYSQKEYLPIAVGSADLAIMKGIKALFDPLNILNPGKIFA